MDEARNRIELQMEREKLLDELKEDTSYRVLTDDDLDLKNMSTEIGITRILCEKIRRPSNRSRGCFLEVPSADLFSKVRVWRHFGFAIFRKRCPKVARVEKERKPNKNEESFENGLLEYPQFTKPQIWEEKTAEETCDFQCVAFERCFSYLLLRLFDGKIVYLGSHCDLSCDVSEGLSILSGCICSLVT